MTLKKKNIIIVFCIITYLLFALTTGGICILNYQSLSSPSQIQIGNSTVILNFTPEDKGLSIPFLITYEKTTPPYRIHFSVYDNSLEVESVEIYEVRVIRPKHKQVYDISRKYDMKLIHRPNPRDSFKLTMPEKYLSIEIECQGKTIKIDTDASFIFELTGSFTTISGEEYPIVIRENIQKKRQETITTFWDFIKSI